MMAEYNILLVCAAGMSTTTLVQRMSKSAQDRQIKANIFAVSANEADQVLKERPIDVLLLGPQVRFLREHFVEKMADEHTKVGIINMQDYGLMNGEKVLMDALKLIINH